MDSLASASGLVALRTLPFVVYVVMSERHSAPRRMLGGLGYMAACLPAWGMQGTHQTWALLATYAHLVPIAAVVSVVARRGRPSVWAHVALLTGLLLALLVLVPASVGGSSAHVAAVLGWELLFSSYSVCAEAWKHERKPTVDAIFFFLFVNPVLVYSQRGSRVEAARVASGLLRALVGLIVLTAGLQLVSDSAAFVLGSRSGTWGERCLACVRTFLLTYLAHSGLASLQIGCMRMIGWEVPERYRMPFLARNPRDFWRRWNVYLGTWLRIYVFLPVSRLARARGIPRGAVGPVGVLLTFGTIGLLHDLATRGVALGSLGYTTLFVSFGLASILWQPFASLAKQRRLALAGGVLARVSMVSLIVAMSAVYATVNR